MAALIAMREREGGGPGHVHVEEGKERGVWAWTMRGRAAVVTRGRRAWALATGSRMGEAREGREGAGSWAGPQGGPHRSAREGERESTDRWVRAVRGPAFKWIKK
jgi:hypothetical protein